MRSGGNRRGFTFIDAVLAVVLVAGGYLALGTVLANTSLMTMECETGMTALMLARGKAAEMRAKEFDGVASISATPFSGAFSGYQYAVTVGYVNASDLDAVVPGPTEYKRIDVAVNYAGSTKTAHLYDLVTEQE